MRLGTLFTGFGGADVGAQAAGLTPVWGIELDPQIAAVATRNLGHPVRVGDILACDPADFAPVDALHASPPCPNFSVANANGGETELDIALARKVAEFVTMLQPRLFTLENVWAYRNSESWAIIADALNGAGYWHTVDHVNAADHGVPQTRKRMIVRAIRGGFVPYMPEAVPWVGWYAAIEDLLPTLPESQFAPWQLARLPELSQTVLVPQNAYEDKDLPLRAAHEPSPTVTASHNQINVRAFLMQVQGEGGDGVRYSDEPMQTVASNHGAAKYRAFLLPGGGNTNLAEAHPGKGCRDAAEPSHTVPAISSEGGAMPKAWLVSGLVAHSYLFGGDNTSNGITARAAREPALTVTTGGPKHPTRALLSHGRVVAMTPRALARFQSFPDSYQLPANARLAAKGIGNAVPPLLMQRIYEQLQEAL